MVEQKDKIPTSPDSFKFNPPQVAPGATIMGGPQSGGYATTPSTEPKPEPEPSNPEDMIRRTTLKREG
jgi:hypothetical protein